MWIIQIKSLESVPERGQDCILNRVLQGVERHPMEPHRAPLGGEGHSRMAHESFHGDNNGRSPLLDEQISMQSASEEVSNYPAFSGRPGIVSKFWSVLCLWDYIIQVHLDIFA